MMLFYCNKRDKTKRLAIMGREILFYSVTLLCCIHLTHQQQPPVTVNKEAAPHDQAARAIPHGQTAPANPHNAHSHHGHHHHHHHKYEEPAARKDPLRNVKIIVPNLPASHYQFWLKNHPRAFANFQEVCKEAPQPIGNISDLATFQQLHQSLHFEDSSYLTNLDYGKRTLELICSKLELVSKSCWGYENNCQEIYLMPECLGTSHGEARDEAEQKIKWFTQADFGYILERRKEFSKYCAPDKRAKLPGASSLECSKHFATCRGENLFLHFRDKFVLTGKPVVLAVGGRDCDLQKERIKQENERRGPLESWYNELGGYKLVNQSSGQCDLTIDKQVFFVKINSSSDLYDYLGTFINLYASMHLNNRFSDDAQLVIWDQRLPRNKQFEQLWYAFSRHPPMSVGEWAGKRVCVKRFVFAMPPKMVDGLHNRQSLIGGCSKSGLYNAFHKHLVHRLGLPMLYDQNLHQRWKNKLVRVTILSRPGQIVNVDELQERIRERSKAFYVTDHDYNSTDFRQLQTYALNSDILVGINGAGLSYTLFAPDWAALIELDDFGKPTYHNLARLRGLSYFTQKDLVKKVPLPSESNQTASHNASLPQDSNYEVNIEAFMKLLDKAKARIMKSRATQFGETAEFPPPSPTEARQEASRQRQEVAASDSSTATTEATTSTSTTSSPASTAAPPSITTTTLTTTTTRRPDPVTTTAATTTTTTTSTTTTTTNSTTTSTTTTTTPAPKPAVEISTAAPSSKGAGATSLDAAAADEEVEIKAGGASAGQTSRTEL